MGEEAQHDPVPGPEPGAADPTRTEPTRGEAVASEAAFSEAVASEAAPSDAVFSGGRRPGFVERRLVQPLLDVAGELDPRLPALGHLSLAMVHEMFVKAVRGAFRGVWLSGTVTVLGLLAALAASGWLRWLVVALIVLPAGGITGAALGLRWSLLRAIHGLTGSYARPEQRAAIRAALRRSRLPTGAFSLVRMLVRIAVRGPRREVLRIHGAARDLAVDLGLGGDDLAGGDPASGDPASGDPASDDPASHDPADPPPPG